jgi:hypothetical protein
MRIYCKGCGNPYGYLDLFKAFNIQSFRLEDCKECRCSDSCGCTIEERECELCGSGSWRILHAGDESNCECEGECWRVCDNPLIEDGCDGIAILIEQEGK